MDRMEQALYREDAALAAKLPLPWELLQDTTVMISGASGMIGSFLIDVLMLQNREQGRNCNIYALGRSEEKMKERFSAYWEEPCFHFLPWSIDRAPEVKTEETIDYLLHLASTTHPLAYATEAVDTVAVNVIGLDCLLRFAARHGTRRFLFSSSCEIYGECPPEISSLRESDCGYLDCNSFRAGYPESKRAGEALCQAYRHETGLEVVIPRFSRTYGPSMLWEDSKAAAQFIKKSVAGEDVILKSSGTQLYSYCYVADAVSGLLYCLLCGEDGEAVNVAGDSIALRDLAAAAAQCSGREVLFQLPEEQERRGYSQMKRSVLNTERLQAMGWTARYSAKEGIRRTIAILKDLNGCEGG